MAKWVAVAAATLWAFVPALALLSHDWTSGKLYSPLARRIADRWNSCTSNTAYHQFKNWGFGSEVHMWSQALCNSFHLNATLLQLDQSWVWNDKKFCAGKELQPLRCYFNVSNHCLEDQSRKPIIDYKNDMSNCPEWIYDDNSRQAFRAAAMEFLFSRLSVDLVEEAKHASDQLFGSSGIPIDMLTVHIRWGDKASEMKLVDAQAYVRALARIVSEARIAKPQVFVVTESTEARTQLSEEVAKQYPAWKVVHYDPEGTSQPVHEKFPVRAAFVSEGATGKASIISLLIALEAKHFVLTTGSNWSRLINELRQNRIDAECGNCTTMVDMQQAHRFHNWRS